LAALAALAGAAFAARADVARFAALAFAGAALVTRAEVAARRAAGVALAERLVRLDDVAGFAGRAERAALAERFGARAAFLAMNAMTPRCDGGG
jgi:hypothetical protein